MKEGKIFVTGRNGFVGRNVCNHLGKKGIPVVDYLKSGGLERGLDVNDLSQLNSINEKIEAVVHLAAKTSINNSFLSPYDTYNTNILGTLNLLEFARRRGITKLINVSTYVYGQPHYLPINETHPVNPHSPYNKSKLLAEQLCHFYSQDFGIDVITLRPFSLYGCYPRPNSFIYCILEQIMKEDGKVKLYGSSTKRDFLFVNDFSRLIENLLRRFPRGYNVYNVGYGKSYSLTEVSRLLAKLLKRKISIVYNTEDKPGFITEIVADISKISKEYGWKPLTSLEQGLAYVVNNLYPGYNPKSKEKIHVNHQFKIDQRSFQ